MELLVFIGIQATGKSSFYREHFFRTHLRINLDALKTRHREKILVAACIEAKAKFVAENTNLTMADRARYIVPARAAGYTVDGYFFQSRVAEALERNAGRLGEERVPDLAIRGASRQLEIPALSEGFDRLFFVRLVPGEGFVIEPWQT
ncbi:MAG: AAA family ATPase [Verrucomicrobiota bacterium]